MNRINVRYLSIYLFYESQWEVANFVHLPFPSAQVKNDEALVLVSVDVMEDVDGGSPELVIDVLSRVFLSDVKPCLGDFANVKQRNIKSLDSYAMSLL